MGHPHGKNNSYGKFPGVSSDKDFGAHKLNGSPWTVMTYNQTNKKGKYNPKYAQFDGFSTNIGPLTLQRFNTFTEQIKLKIKVIIFIN